MPRVFRQQYTRPIPADAERIAHKGKPAVRFKGRGGKPIVAFLTRRGDRYRIASPIWYGHVPDPEAPRGCRRVPLCGNKAAAEIMLGELCRQAELGKAGARSPCEQHNKCPLAEHVADYRRELEARGNEPRYCQLVASRLTALFDGCGFRFLPDLSASGVMDWLAGLRRDAAMPQPLSAAEAFTRSEAAGLLDMTPTAFRDTVRRQRLPVTGQGPARRFPRSSTVEAVRELMSRGHSVQTTNYYLSHLKSFCRWLVRDRRKEDNPVAHLEAGNAKVDRRHDRRELTADELRSLLDAAGRSERTFRGMTGWDRFHLYATACGTGFRASALASLTPESFELDAEIPTVALPARRNKSRVTKVQPLPGDVAELLRDYLRDKPAGVPLWGGTWERAGKGAEMLRIDLEAAGIPYAVDSPDGLLFADFHALRHSYLTLGARAGIDLRTLQELAGHSTPTLTARYTHCRLRDQAGAVDQLPSILPKAPATEAPAMRATGTDGANASTSVDSAYTALTQESDRGCVSLRLHETGTANALRTPASASADGLRGLQADESGCDGLREEAPPGFEPGMADLQSVAAPPQV